MAHRTIIEDYLAGAYVAGNYRRIPDISCRDKWENVDPGFRDELIKAGERASNEPWPQLLVSDFTWFSQTGERERFENKYFTRRRKLNALIMAECLENKGRFLKDILDGFYLILEETSWCLPAHNSYIRDTKQEYLPDVSRPIIDLFDAETGALLALGEHLLRPVFEMTSPYISEYVNRRLSERIFDPYFEYHFWWMGNGKEPMCNWTVWCTQNVLICALTRPEGFFGADDRRMDFLKKAASSMDYFLDDYGDDGCCNEGAQYYSHAGLCLFGCLELMDGALDGGKEQYAEASGKRDFSGVYSEPLIKNVAEYIAKMHVSGDTYINFADCSRVCGRRTAREYLFGRAVRSTNLMALAIQDFHRSSLSGLVLGEEINLFYHVLQLFTYGEIMAAPEVEAVEEDSFFASTGLMIARDGTYTLAAKAGCNADSHNHNDVGSFTIYKNGKPLVIDLGVGTYTRETFSDRRYEIWTMQSQFHNLPTFVGSKASLAKIGRNSGSDYYDSDIVMQKDGAKYKANDTLCNLGQTCAASDNSVQERTGKVAECSGISMDIAPAYGDGRIRSYRRLIALFKGSHIEVSDEYDGDLTAALSIMTYEKPELSKDPATGSFVLKLGTLGNIEAHGAEDATLQTYPIEDERLKTAWEHQVYRVLLTIDDGHKLTLMIN